MRTNKIILDEAARSIRRTFIGSIAGSVSMLAVIGAAGAYGMPERLNAQSLTQALTSLHAKFSPMLERAMAELPPSTTKGMTRTASAAMTRTASVAMPMADDGTAPPATLPSPAPMPAATPFTAVEPRPIVEAAPSPIVEVAPPVVAAVPAPVTVVEPKPAAPQIASAPVLVRPFEPEPTATAALNIKRPERIDTAIGRAELTAPPTETAAPLTTAMLPDPASLSEREIVEEPRAMAAPAAEPAPSIALPVSEIPLPLPKPAILKQTASLGAAPDTDEIRNTVDAPRLVSIELPRPKPPLTPAQRLDLSGKDYDKAEKCLAQAVYFEARNEPARGQQAVAQVVLNRVFSPYYPKDVCSVVYQNAHRHLSCQFTFACDGKPEAIRERGAWARANRIAKQTLEAQVWLPEVNKATHYHAAYVHPRWVRDMRVMVRYGLHTFYRPRNWGDGSHEPSWGSGALKKARPS